MNGNLFPALFFIGVVIATIGAFFLCSTNNVAWKKRLIPCYAFFLVVVFGFFLVIINFPLPLGLPMGALVAFLNVKFMKFCNHCGFIAGRREWWLKLDSCPRCGTNFTNGERIKLLGSEWQ